MSIKAKGGTEDTLHGMDAISVLQSQEPIDIMTEMDDMDPERAMKKLETTQTTGTNEPYSVFPQWRRYSIGVLGSMTGLLSPLTANIYLPALIAIQKDLDTTAELVNISVTVYMVFQGLAPAFWGSVTDLWGRRPVYLTTLLVYIGACVGLALIKNYPGLLVLRMLQATGSSSVIAIGAGIVGDITTPEERGTFYGVYSVGQLLGPVLGPVIGGAVTETLGWHWIFWILTILASTLYLCLFFFLPETLRALVGNGSGYANPTPWQYVQRQIAKRRGEPLPPAADPGRFKRMPNLFASFIYLTNPDIFFLLMFNAFQYAMFYCVLTSTPDLFTSMYGLSEMQIGLCYLALSVGCIIGSVGNGRILDYSFSRVVRKTGIQAKRGRLPLEFPIYKTRLGVVWVPSILMICAMIAYGWALHYNAPLAVALVLQFFCGLCTTAVSGTTQTLMVDLFPGKGASITGSANFTRCLLGALGTVAIQPGIERIGVGWMFTAISLVLVAVFSFIPILLKFGPKWRQRREEKNMERQRKKQQESAIIGGKPQE